MQNITPTIDNTDHIRGVTLRERAQLVLMTLGRTPDEINRAFRRLAKRHHPDAAGGDEIKFKMINEAYQLLNGDRTPKHPLLAVDELVMRTVGRQVAALLHRQQEWINYERKHHAQFHDGDWLYPQPAQRPTKRRRPQ
ncbi:MAG: DnaJ domain-containing protein [Kiritimatiellia bacterium]